MKVYVNKSTKLKGRGLLHAGEHDLTKEEIKSLKEQGFIGEDKPATDGNTEALKAEVTRLSGELEKSNAEVTRLSGELDGLKLQIEELKADKPADLTK